jgi:beta-phosphoglucomutase
MPHWPRAVLFDFDGVIVNSEPLHFLAMHDVVKEHGIELTESEYFDELIGFDDRGAVRRLFELRERELDAKTSLAILGRKSRVMMNLIEGQKVRALPGVEELVRGLWRNYPLAICSGAMRDEIEAMLLGVALRDCFEVIVSAEDVSVGKPDPSGYVLAAGQLSERTKAKLRPEDCLVVEDAPTVIRSVKAAGFPTLAVASSYGPEKLSDATYVVKSLRPSEVLERIPNLKVTA